VPVLAVVNQKGGVGKTTTVVNLSAFLGAIGQRVLVVDCDAQANATSGLGHGRDSTGLFDVLFDGIPAGHAVVRTGVAGVELLPATTDLAGAELELAGFPQPIDQLRVALEDTRDQYSFVLLDCPPSLGLLTANALVAADAVLVPVQCEYLALEGLARLTTTLERVRTQSNRELRLFGLLLTMFDARTSLSRQVVEEVRGHYPTLTFDVVIPRSVRLSEAPGFGQSILEYDPTCRGATAYQELSLEVVARARNRAAPVSFQQQFNSSVLPTAGS
jgi:chromosome partitioning protein